MSAVEITLTDIMDKIVVDDWGQCRKGLPFGALRRHVDEGRLDENNLHAELGQIVAGMKPGRERDDETNPLLASRALAFGHRARLRDARQGEAHGHRPHARLPVSFVACTRMYDVTPDVRRHWHALMTLAAGAAGIAVECIDHAPPAPLTELWARDDLVLGYMCGLPLATRYPEVQPLAAPVTACATDDEPTYRSAWLARADSVFDTLASTFGHRIGWTVEHSHSGFNAPRYALLAHRSAARPTLYRESVGPLGDPRAALAALADRRIDVTAIDAYWWWLFERHDPVAASFRIIGETASAPMPPLICAPGLARSLSTQLVDALEDLNRERSAAVHLDALGIRRFARVARADYAVLAELDRAAREAGYPTPR